jgi:coenzyme F420-0:L-glutamate ligase/coenzyme F420-1:gamma-L-glutamate ligase
LTRQLTLTALPDIPKVQEGDDLTAILLASLDAAGIELQDGDVLVLAQKIVSKAEGRLVYLPEVEPSREATALAEETEKDPRLVELILRESREILRKRPGLIVIEHKLGFVCANAGIDHSNAQASIEEADDWVLLLPQNPDASAQKIREKIETATGAGIGVLVIDSHGRAWRLGTVGFVIGIAGVPGLVDLRGQPDLFGYELRVTEVGAADELAAAASLVMGQAAEGLPAIHARGFPYQLREASLHELLRPKETDMFR